VTSNKATQSDVRYTIPVVTITFIAGVLPGGFVVEANDEDSG
jgi:hypothetical protein